MFLPRHSPVDTKMLTPIVHPKLILAAAVFIARRGSFPPAAGVRPSPERGSVTRSSFADKEAFRLSDSVLKNWILLRVTDPRSAKKSRPSSVRQNASPLEHCFGRARHSVRAVGRTFDVRTSHHARGGQRTARPTVPSAVRRG